MVDSSIILAEILKDTYCSSVAEAKMIDSGCHTAVGSPHREAGRTSGRPIARPQERGGGRRPFGWLRGAAAGRAGQGGAMEGDARAGEAVADRYTARTSMPSRRRLR